MMMNKGCWWHKDMRCLNCMECHKPWVKKLPPVNSENQQKSEKTVGKE